MSEQVPRKVVLSKEELKFLQNLKKGNMKEYTPNYTRVLKHRILRKHRQLAHEALLIDEVLDKLQALKEDKGFLIGYCIRFMVTKKKEFSR